MKDADKILDSELKKLNQNGFIQMFYKINRSKILDIIKTIQNDAYNQAIDDAAKNATYIGSGYSLGTKYDYHTPIGVDKQSILILKKK